MAWLPQFWSQSVRIFQVKMSERVSFCITVTKASYCGRQQFHLCVDISYYATFASYSFWQECLSFMLLLLILHIQLFFGVFMNSSFTFKLCLMLVSQFIFFMLTGCVCVQSLVLMLRAINSVVLMFMSQCRQHCSVFHFCAVVRFILCVYVVDSFIFIFSIMR